MRPRAPRRRGSVLVVAMVLVAAMAAIGMALAARTKLAEERALENLARGEAILLARGSMRTVENLLAEEDAAFDAKTDLWNRGLFWSTEEGSVIVVIEDESSRFPLERVYANERLNLDARDAFLRLLAALDIPERISDAAVDYADPDDDPFPLGAEADAYAARARGISGAPAPPRTFTPPFLRPPNRPFRVPEEVLLLEGLSPEEAPRLAAAVTTLGGGLVNLNTASPEVLRALSSRITPDLAASIAAHARRTPFKKLEEVSSVPGMPNGLAAEIAPWADVRAGAFRIHIQAEVRGTKARLTYVLRRSPQIETIYYRE